MVNKYGITFYLILTYFVDGPVIVVNDLFLYVPQTQQELLHEIKSTDLRQIVSSVL